MADTLVKVNLTAERDPTVNDDESEGYGVFSQWMNTLAGRIWDCFDPSTGAAVWKRRSNRTVDELDALGIDAATLEGSGAAAFAASSHNHTLSDITDSGTSAALDVPVTGDAAVGEVVKGDDSRLSDARTPTSHTHVIADITDIGSWTGSTSITTLGTITTGTWQGTLIDNAYLDALAPTTGSADEIVTDDGLGGLTSHSGLTVIPPNKLLITDQHGRFGIGTIGDANTRIYSERSSNNFFGIKTTSSTAEAAFYAENDTGSRIGFSMYSSGHSRANQAIGSSASADSLAFGVGKSTADIRFYTQNDFTTPKISIQPDGSLIVGSQNAPTGTATKVLIQGDNAGHPTPGGNTGGFYNTDVGGTVTPHCVDEAANWRNLIRAAGEGIITSDTTVANTVTETTVYTESIGANTLAVGQVVRTRVLGRYSTANGTDTFTARLYVGGTLVDSITSTAGNVTDAAFDVEFLFTVRSLGASGTIYAQSLAHFDDEVKQVADTGTTTIDTESADDVTLTIEWSTDDAGNTLTVSQGFAQFIG